MINLLPPSIKSDIRFAKYNVTLVQYVFVVAVTVAIVAFLMLFGKQTLTNTKADIEKVLVSDRARVAELQAVNKEAKQLSGTVDTIGNLLDQEVRFSLLLQEIGSIMPSGAKLSALALSQDTSEPVRLSVDLTTAEKAGVLQQNISESRLFIGADIISVTQGDAADGYGFAADLQAFYDPGFSLNTLDDPVEETPSEETTPNESESPSTQQEEQGTGTTPAEGSSEATNEQEAL